MSVIDRYRRITIAFLLTASPAAFAGNGVSVSELALEAAQLAHVLGVEYIGKSVTLPEPSDHLSVRLDFYKKGELIFSKNASGVGTQSKESHFNISVIMTDSNHLQLGTTPKNHIRIDVQIERLAEDKGLARSSFDVSKLEFGRGASTGIGGSSRPPVREYHDPTADAIDGKTMEIPIAYCIKGDGNKMIAETPEDTVRQNPDADVMVVYVVYTAPGE